MEFKSTVCQYALKLCLIVFLILFTLEQTVSVTLLKTNWKCRIMNMKTGFYFVFSCRLLWAPMDNGTEERIIQKVISIFQYTCL